MELFWIVFESTFVIFLVFLGILKLFFEYFWKKYSPGEILWSALHRMQESLKMFDFPGGLLPSTYNPTFGRAETFYKKYRKLLNSGKFSATVFLRLSFLPRPAGTYPGLQIRASLLTGSAKITKRFAQGECENR